MSIPFDGNTVILIDDPGPKALAAILKKGRLTREKGNTVLLVLGGPNDTCANLLSGPPPYASAQFLRLDASSLPYGAAVGWRNALFAQISWEGDDNYKGFDIPAAAHPDVSPRGPTQAAPFPTRFYVFAPPCTPAHHP